MYYQISVNRCHRRIRKHHFFLSAHHWSSSSVLRTTTKQQSTFFGKLAKNYIETILQYFTDKLPSVQFWFAIQDLRHCSCTLSSLLFSFGLKTYIVSNEHWKKYEPSQCRDHDTFSVFQFYTLPKTTPVCLGWAHLFLVKKRILIGRFTT